jgi:hypothetical protein
METPSRMAGMLLWGTANPEGMENDYQGIFLNKEDIKSMVRQVEQATRRAEKIPVHLEHKGVAVGHVVTAWAHKDTLQCVLKLDERVLEGSIGSEFVRNGICNELSLGYAVDLQNSATGLAAVNKTLKEISVVKKGARHHCQIHAVTGKSGGARSAN